MKVCKLFLAGALAITTNAASDPPDTNPPIAYFVSYGRPGCLKEDQSAYITLVQTQDSVCYDFAPPPPTIIQSAYVTSIIKGCVVYVYNDGNCTKNEQTLDLGFKNCYNDTAGFGSYKVICGGRYPIPHTITTSTSLSASASL